MVVEGEKKIGTTTIASISEVKEFVSKLNNNLRDAIYYWSLNDWNQSTVNTLKSTLESFSISSILSFFRNIELDSSYIDDNSNDKNKDIVSDSKKISDLLSIWKIGESMNYLIENPQDLDYFKDTKTNIFLDRINQCLEIVVKSRETLLDNIRERVREWIDWGDFSEPNIQDVLTSLQAINKHYMNIFWVHTMLDRFINHVEKLKNTKELQSIQSQL